MRRPAGWDEAEQHSVLKSPSGLFKKGILTNRAKAAGWTIADPGPYNGSAAKARAEHLQFASLPFMSNGCRINQ